jgi:hypothetical protein
MYNIGIQNRAKIRCLVNFIRTVQTNITSYQNYEYTSSSKQNSHAYLRTAKVAAYKSILIINTVPLHLCGGDLLRNCTYYTLNMSDITAKIRMVSMFVIFNFQPTFHTQCVRTFMFYRHTKFSEPSSSTSGVNATKPTTEQMFTRELFSYFTFHKNITYFDRSCVPNLLPRTYIYVYVLPTH